RYHASPGAYQPQVREDVMPTPPIEPCSVPGDIVGDGICNLGGGWDELVAEPRSEPGKQISFTKRRREPTIREADLRQRYGSWSGAVEPDPDTTFRCAK